MAAQGLGIRSMTKALRALTHGRARVWMMHYRYGAQGVMDALAWWVALAFACWMRFEFETVNLPASGLLLFGVLAAQVQTVAGMLTGLYIGRWRFGSFESISALARAVLLTTTVLFLVDIALPAQPLPRSVVLGASPFALVIMGMTRAGLRAILDRRRRPSADQGDRLIVFGAGEAGFQIVSSLLRAPDSPYVPVALLDDDPEKRNLRILGVRVLGTRVQLGVIAQRFNAKAVLIAIPSARPDLIREISAVAAECNLAVMVLPPVADLLGAVGIEDIRPLTEADLLGRHQIETDIASIAGYLTGKRVLVTGAGGSIGSELCRQIDRFAPAELIMLDRDESALHAVQLAIEGRALLDTPNVVLADIRDAERVADIFHERRPEVVFHAAALKHLPMLEQYPAEAVKTNVWGTLNVLHAAASVSVERFVNISTDKAADPTSVLGYSKRVAERLTAHIASSAAGAFLSVRFGNVLGSRGSVLTTFRAQVESGGPITVTDPEVTRYFMTIEEAVELVIQAGAIGRAGEALVLDMGEPVRIYDVARRFATQGPRPIDVVFTGLRGGEKLHEVLFSADEPDHRPIHPLISHVRVPSLHPHAARLLSVEGPADAVRTSLAVHCAGVETRLIP
jgi:FlaA1/EpsC-like NDP-sugar epimerase